MTAVTITPANKDARSVLFALKTKNFSNGPQGYSKAATLMKARIKAQQKETTVWHVLSLGPFALPVDVTLTRFAPSVGLDYDGLVTSLKHVRDGVAHALKVDDNDPRIHFEYAQERCPSKQYFVGIEIRRRES